MPKLHTRPAGFLSWSVTIFRGESRLTDLRISLFRSRGSFELEGESYSIQPQGFFLRRAELRKGASVLARAEKASFIRRRFAITAAGHRLELESRSFFGREYALLLGEKEVGWVRRRGLLGRHCEVDFPDEVPAFLQIFLVYLSLAQAKREAARSGG